MLSHARWAVALDVGQDNWSEMMPRDNVVRLAVVGLGNIARAHIDNVRSGLVADCELSALCSRSPDSLSSELGVPHFQSVQALIDSDCSDAVLIATPTFDHYTSGSAALAAGLHVMMEKPLGISVKEAEDLLAAHASARASGQVFALMLNQRADPLFLAMRDIIASGRLGPIMRTHWTMTNWFRPEVYFQVSDWRATWKGEGGGLLMNQCIHNLDIYAWLCGMPQSLQAHCQFGRYHRIEVEDEATAHFQYANGATGVFVGSTGEAPGVNRFDIVGDKGSLGFDGQRLWLSENATATSQFSATTRELFGMPDSTTTDITPERDVNQHAAVLSNFCAAIVRDEQLIAPAADGLNSLSLANAMLLSTWENRSVELPLDSAAYQCAIEQRIAGSTLREKADIEATVDMSASYR